MAFAAHAGTGAHARIPDHRHAQELRSRACWPRAVCSNARCCRPISPKRRWFAPKDQKLERVRIALLHQRSRKASIALVEIETDTPSGTARWLLPLAIAWEDEPTAALATQLALARVRHGARVGLLTDAFALPDLAHGVLTDLAQAPHVSNRRRRRSASNRPRACAISACRPMSS